MKRLLLLIVLLVLANAEAATIGVSPSIIRFDKMMRGGYAQAPVTVSSDTPQSIGGEITTEGDIAEWISFQPGDGRFSVSLDNPYELTIVIEPPEDTPTGNYTGRIKFTTDTLASVESGAGSSIIAQIMLNLNIEIIGEEIVQCRAGAIYIRSAEVQDPVEVRATIFNDGNVRLRPRMVINVYDKDQISVLMTKTLFGQQILPTLSKEVNAEFTHDLDPGQYFAEVYLQDCGISRRVTFDIVEKGGIADNGELIGIKTNNVINLGETTPIIPMFRNTGPRKVIAQFKGDVKKKISGKIVMPLISDALEVSPGEMMEFPMLFTPEDAGEYVASGRVTYNNKITFESSSLIEVKRPGFDLSGIFIFIIYVAIGLIILILIASIRKRR